jgi:hypothetical protein
MPVKLTFDSKDVAPEGIREHLQEKDGKWFFEAETVTEVAGLKSALDKERSGKSDLEKQLSKFKDIDPEKARQLLSEYEKGEQDRLKAQGDWESREKQLLDKHNLEKAAKESEIEKLRASLEENLIERDAAIAITNAKGSVTLLMPHLRRFTKMVNEHDKWVARVVDEQGNVRIGDAQGNPMTIEQLVTEMSNKKEFKPAFGPSGNGGSGGPSIMSSGPTGGTDFSKLSGTEKLKFARRTQK